MTFSEQKFGNEVYELEKTVQQQFSDLIEDIIDQHNDKLSKIFSYYCLYGEPLNTNKLKSSKFIKLLRDSGVLLKGVFNGHQDSASSQRNFDGST